MVELEPFRSASVASRHQARGFEFRARQAFQSLAGEERREVDVQALAEEKQKRKKAQTKIPV